MSAAVLAAVSRRLRREGCLAAADRAAVALPERPPVVSLRAFEDAA